ncbi:MAG TPA: glucose-1-phosphate cytidylyltransferase [Terriglobales bacterium]|nr:glucose-1-phosphate cytidylyltransferase [Terriglobales bacterium]
MRVIILCGGLGTRLREETEFKPKPMVEIGGKPILWHIMKQYEHRGFRDFLLCVGYRGEVIRDYFINYQMRSRDIEVNTGTGEVKLLGETLPESAWTVKLQDTGVHCLTGSRIKAALRYVEDDCFLATYGDGVSDVDIGAVIEHHKRSGKLATVTAVRPSSRFGELSLEGDVVHSFNEKPQTAEGWINGGFFVFEKRAFEQISADDPNISLEGGLLEHLAARRQLSVYRHTGFWQCMDTYRELCLLEDMWKSGQAPWKTWVS